MAWNQQGEDCQFGGGGGVKASSSMYRMTYHLCEQLTDYLCTRARTIHTLNSSDVWRKKGFSCEKSNGGIAIENGGLLKKKSLVLPAPLCRTTEAE